MDRRDRLTDVEIVKNLMTTKNLLSSDKQTRLVWRDALFVVNLLCDLHHGVRGFNIKGEGFAGQSLDENLHIAEGWW
jgi:hypothetical protein